MKKREVKWLSCCTALLVGASALADDATGAAASTRTPDNARTATTATGTDLKESKHFFSSKTIVGATVKDNAGAKLGEIEELYLDPQKGAVFAVVDIEGNRDALVPLQALSITPAKGLLSSAEVSLNKSKTDVQSGPLLTRNEWGRLDDSSFTRSIYTHYQVDMPATGAASSPGDVTTGSSYTGREADTSVDREDKDHPSNPDNR